MRYTIAFFYLFSFQILFAQNQLPLITNLTVDLNELNLTLVVTYDLFDAENDEMDVRFLISDNGGISYDIDTGNAVGDLGPSNFSGDGKTISWDANGLLTGSGNYQIKIIANDNQVIDIQDIVDQVDISRLQTNLGFIEGVRHRVTNPSHLQAIKDSIEERFISAGLETYRQDFPFENTTGQNIIGRLEGGLESNDTYIIDGHFDTVDDSPGADDNGSAVAGMLEALRVLSQYSFKKTIRFIGFDLEEDGLVGSFNFADNISADENILGVFNMEMIGYYTDQPNTQSFPFGFELLYPDVQAELEADQFRGNFITNICDQNSISLQNAYNDAAEEYVPELKIISLAAPESWLTLTPDFGRSDHAPFWLKNIPALMLTDGSNFRNPNYHTPNDLASTLDFDFMTNVVKGVVAAVAEEASVQHSTQATAQFSIVSGIYSTLDCDVIVAPIPARDHIQIQFGDCQFKNLQVQLIDNMGRLILDESPRSSENGFTLPLHFVDAGMYYLRLSDGSRQLNQKVMVF